MSAAAPEKPADAASVAEQPATSCEYTREGYRCDRAATQVNTADAKHLCARHAEYSRRFTETCTHIYSTNDERSGETCGRTLTTPARIAEKLCYRHRIGPLHRPNKVCDIFECTRRTRGGAARCYMHQHVCEFVCAADGQPCERPLTTPARVAEGRCIGHRKSVTG